MKKILIFILTSILVNTTPVELSTNQVMEEPMEVNVASRVIEDQIIEEEVIEEEIFEEEIIEEEIEPEYAQPHFNPYNLRELSNLTREQSYEILEGTELQAVSATYIYLEELYNINAFFLMALSAHESGWGTSYRAMYQNNLTGYAVYSAEAEGSYFSSWSESLEYTAALLDSYYLDEEGAYFNGYSTEAVNIRYCLLEDQPDWNWSNSINNISYQLLERSYNYE